MNGCHARGYQGEIDLFLVYCPETKKIYSMPVEDAPDAEGYLRVSPSRNGQVQGIRWASEFELPE